MWWWGPRTFLGALGMAAVTIAAIKIVVAIWMFLVGVIVVVAVGLLLLLWWGVIAARREAEAARVAALIERADRQHTQVQRGDLRGIYGEYGVPDECRGIGIWLCDPQPHTAERRRGEPQRRSRLAG